MSRAHQRYRMTGTETSLPEDTAPSTSLARCPHLTRSRLLPGSAWNGPGKGSAGGARPRSHARRACAGGHSDRPEVACRPAAQTYTHGDKLGRPSGTRGRYTEHIPAQDRRPAFHGNLFKVQRLAPAMAQHRPSPRPPAHSAPSPRSRRALPRGGARLRSLRSPPGTR